VTSPLPTPLPGIADLLLDAVFLVGSDGRIAYVSAACERLLGYAPDEMTGRLLRDFIAPEDRERTQREAERVMAGKPRIGFENRYLHKDGRRVHLMWSARWSEADRLRIGVARDVTEQRQAEALRAAVYAISEAAHDTSDLDALYGEIHRIVATLVPVAAFAIATCDRQSRQLHFPYQRNHHGEPTALQTPVVCRHCLETIRTGQPSLLHDDVLAALRDDEGPTAGGPWLTLPLPGEDGPIGALVLHAFPGSTYGDADKALLQYVAEQVATAIERRHLHAELLRAARHDDLTGLPNRRLFADRLASALTRAERNGRHLALLYVDLDDFKQVNDTQGHAAGDALLRETALRLTACVRETDTVARLGGDEFVLILDEIHGPDDAAAVAAKIRNAMTPPVAIGDQALPMRASIGIACYPEHGTDATQLMKHADATMYRDKRTGERPAARTLSRVAVGG